jgi:kynureninase
VVERADLARSDAADPLASLRDRVELPPDVVYLDGNSLGPLCVGVAARVRLAVEHGWGEGLIRSWNDAGWADLPRRAAERIAPLIGADADEVAVTDSTSADLFRLLVAMARLRPDRRVLLTDDRNFPTDRYVAGGVADLLGLEVRVVPAGDLADALDPSVAVVTATEVDYRTGVRHDLATLTGAAHDVGALTVWDLSHSTGAVHVDLQAIDADAAVGCTYKYLNGGPGAPAYLHVARRHHAEVSTPVRGWFGHAEPFAFSDAYAPAPGAARFHAGTPAVLSLVALDAALDAWDGVDMRAVAARGRELTDLFVGLVDRRLGGLGITLASPRDASVRGAQVSLAHPEAHRVMRALIDRGVVGDHRPPDLLRFGLAPFYVSRVEMWDAVEMLRSVLADGAWRDPAYTQRTVVP